MASSTLLVAKNKSEIHLLSNMANRHGLIAGATGTGKTITLQVMAEKFSQIGVPVILADVKGDLSGIGWPGALTPKLEERLKLMQLDSPQFSGSPITFWDVFGKEGHPLRTTVSEMGPMLFSRLLNLNEVQSGVLSIIFKVADDQGLLLLDLKDLRAMAEHVSNNATSLKAEYGNVSPASVGAIQRGLLELEQQGAELFFGEPAVTIDDFIQTASSGKGMVNVLSATQLLQNPRLYSCVLLWLLSELFENLPEVGDLEKPKLVFFFDEAHLLFDEAPKVLVDRIEQVVRLIRSKGVGVYFVTQNPLDIPLSVLGQLSNRVQHALRAFTPLDQKAVKAAAQTFRPNPAVDVASAITELGVGEALLSFLDEKGMPSVVERALICPPQSQIGAVSAGDRQAAIQKSAIYGVYEKTIDRESAYERLKQRASDTFQQNQQPVGVAIPNLPPMKSVPRPVGRPRDTLVETMAKSAARSVASSVGRALVRGVLGGLLGGRR